MSIIQEALKKAQPPQKQTTAPKNRRSIYMAIGLIIFVILTLFAVKGFLFKEGPLLKTDVEDATARQEITYKPITPKTESEPRAKPMPLLKKAYEAKFALNGIMFLNDGPQAIINNSVVKEGDVIGAAKVVRINKNNVVLNLNDLEITLNLKK